MRTVETTAKKINLYDYEDMTNQEIAEYETTKVYEKFYVNKDIFSEQIFNNLEEKPFSNYNEYLEDLLRSGFLFTLQLTTDEKETFIHFLLDEIEKKNLKQHSIKLREFINDEKLYFCFNSIITVNQLKFMDKEKIKERYFIQNKINKGSNIVHIESEYESIKNNFNIIELSELSDKQADEIYYNTERKISLESFLELI